MMRRIWIVLALLSLLCLLTACGRKQQEEEVIVFTPIPEEYLDSGPTPVPNPQLEAEIAEALAQEDENAELDWDQGLLSRVPRYAGSGDVVDWAVTDKQAVVSLWDTTSDEVEWYVGQLEEEGFLGELVVMGGVDRYTGDFVHAERRVHVNLLFTAQTNELEYSTLVITVIPL